MDGTWGIGIACMGIVGMKIGDIEIGGRELER